MLEKIGPPPLPRAGVLSNSPNENCSTKIAAQAVMLLLGCYRRDDVGDPEVYSRAVEAVFARYPEAVVREVSDPSRGLPSRLKWLPSIAEIREACDSVIGADGNAEQRKRRIAETRRYLDGDQPDEDERARNAEGLKALAEELSGPCRRTNREVEQDNAEARLEFLLEKGGALAEPFTIGPDLAEKLAAIKRGDAH